MLRSSLFLSFSLTLNKLEKCSTHFFGGIESTWFELLFVFPLSLLIYCQKSLGLLDKHSNTLMFSIFHFCLIVLMVCLYFLFILLYWPRVWGFLGNFWTCLASCSNCLLSVSHVSLYQIFDCLLFFIGPFLCFSVLSTHSFINLVKRRIIFWKLLLFLMISKSLQGVLIVICHFWLFITILKRMEFRLSQW